MYALREAIQKAHFDFVNNIFQVSAVLVGSRIFPYLQKTKTFTECKRIGTVIVNVASIQNIQNKNNCVIASASKLNRPHVLHGTKPIVEVKRRCGPLE